MGKQGLQEGPFGGQMEGQSLRRCFLRQGNSPRKSKADGMVTHFFRTHGEFCASHPWEVIVATLTLTACMLSADQQQPSSKPALRYGVGCLNEAKYNAVDVIAMTMIRCLAVLYCYYQFCNLHRMGSKYVLGIAGFFTVFSSFVFTLTVLNILQIDVSEIKDALFFFVLLIDLSKIALLAEFALSASNPKDIKNNIARGMAVLGPTITLNTIVETLLIGVGTLSGVHRLEMLSYFACLAVVVNYAVFMTFYPACLSLLLELSDVRRSFISRAFNGKDQEANPVVERVKLIMSVGLMLVHTHSWWLFRGHEDATPPLTVEQDMALNLTDDNLTEGYIIKWVTLSLDHIVVLILLLALILKFTFFENKESFELRVRNSKLKTSNTCQTQAQLLLQKEFKDKEVQTSSTNELCNASKAKADESFGVKPIRSLDKCLHIYKSELGASALTNEEVVLLVSNKYIPAYQIEKAVADCERGVEIRRRSIGCDEHFAETLSNLPYKNYDYSKVMGACCENVIGYVPIPVGVAVKLNLDGRLINVPMATTEGCLVASTNRGSRALLKCGVKSRIVADGMTRGPVVRFPSLDRASEALYWLEKPENFQKIKERFDSSSSFARLTKIHVRLFGRLLFIRFVAKTGDAMGMNMLSKGTDLTLKFVQNTFSDMEILSVSGNFCADKKPAAVNWIEGRGKSVVCEAVVPADVVLNILKTTVSALIDVNISKNLIGSAVAGSIGGFNAQAANIVTAIFIATGQDPAQNVTSSNCMTLMEPWGENGEDLYITCTMPSIEVGTVGGGTILPAQGACLEMLGVRGANLEFPGDNSNQLARIICGTVLAGELSLMAALAAGHLVQSHLRHNRSSTAGL